MPAQCSWIALQRVQTRLSLCFAKICWQESQESFIWCALLFLFLPIHLQMILCFSNRGLLFIFSKVKKVFLISHSDNFGTSKINFSCFKCSNPSSASHAQMELEFSFLDWNCHYSITTNQNKAFAPFTFFLPEQNVHISPCDLISAAILLPGPKGVWREGREVQMSRTVDGSVFSEKECFYRVCRSSGTQIGGCSTPRSRTDWTSPTPRGRKSLEKIRRGCLPCSGCCDHLWDPWKCSWCRALEKKTTMMTSGRRCLECKNGEWLGSFNIYT